MEKFLLILRNMKKSLLVCLLTVFLAKTILAQDPEKNSEGFLTIFDGADLSMVDTEGNWVIQEDGSLFLKPREGEKGWKRYHHYVWLKGSYSDFECEFEYKHEKGGNSGFYFRVSDRADPVNSGFEVQIKDSEDLGDDEMGPHDLGGVIKTKGATANPGKPAGQWNKMKVTMKGNHLKVVLNDVTIQDFDLAEAKPEDKALAAEGFITIQDHGIPFWVRNIRVKRL